MIKSMTGYGKAEAEISCGKLTVEIRTLNGKTADINIKSPLLPRELELSIRSKLSAALQRGTIDVYLNLENRSDVGGAVNGALLKSYFNEIQKVMDEMGRGGVVDDDRSAAEIVSSVLRFPDVVGTRKQDAITVEDYPAVEAAVDSAVIALDAFRSREGAVLYRDVTSRIKTILSLYDGVEALEGERVEAVKDRLRKNLQELQVKVSPERFEQEMIFYLEKLDINEEKVRLRQHCHYFMETIDNEAYPGKKLGFIIQEMGREINTTGSKANHAGIQRLVVMMKDELEKVREQSLNIL